MKGKKQLKLIRGGDARTVEQRLAIVDYAAGAWKGRRETGASYVERLRSGRLTRSHRKRD